MQVETQSSLSVNFYPSPNGGNMLNAPSNGVLDLGSVSYSGADGNTGVKIHRFAREFSVETNIGLKVGSTQQQAGGTAMLKAWLEEPVDPYRIYLDGVALSLQPELVVSHQQLGTVTSHALKIVVPTNAAQNNMQFTTAIAVQVVMN